MNKRERTIFSELMNSLRAELGGSYFRRNRPMSDEDELSLTEFSTLMLLRRDGPRSVKELAADLRKSSSMASRLVDRLQRKGFVERQPSTTDRRWVRVSTTARGDAVLAGYEEQHNDAHLAFYEELTAKERKQVFGAFGVLRKALERRRARRAEKKGK